MRVRRMRLAWLIIAVASLSALTLWVTSACAHPAGVRCVRASSRQPPTPADSWQPSAARRASHRVCPPGRTPDAIASSKRPHAGDKGILGISPNGTAKRGNPGYYYVSFFQQPSLAVPGTYADVTVAKPTLDRRDSHTLAEIAAQSADGRQIVEIGWTVDRGINGGSAAPHLFTFSWIDGVGQGYNAANPYFHAYTGGSQANPNSYFTGMELPVSAAPRRFVIWHYMGNWLLGIAVPGTTNIDYVGYFPDSEWSGSFTSMGLVQWFGEVNDANDGLHCTQMGNGVFGTASGSASVGSPALIHNDAGNSTPASPTLISPTTPSNYNGRVATGNFGGPGPCAAAPPRPRITQHPAARERTTTQHASVTFGFTSGAGSFRCSLDDGRFSRCSSPKAYRVGLGRHSFSVKAINGSGQSGPAASFDFRVVHRTKHHAG